MSFYLGFELVIKHHKTNLPNSKRTRISKTLDTSFRLKTRAVNEKNTGEGAFNFKRLISKQFKLAKGFAMTCNVINICCFICCFEGTWERGWEHCMRRRFKYDHQCSLNFMLSYIYIFLFVSMLIVVIVTLRGFSE